VILEQGAQLGAYEILAPLGAGGMGEVYRARDTRLGRHVAIKLIGERLAPDAAARKRFEREARAIAALSHPNIVALYDIGDHDGLTFAVMELLEGEPLDRRLARGGVSVAEAIDIAAAVADGIASAHARGVVHRDIKPANIFITRDGVVKILDFCLASAVGVPNAGAAWTQETVSGALLGTVGYMSPEQARGERADHRTDVFSLGCVLYELVSGRRPFQGSTAAETLAAVLRDDPPPLSAAAAGSLEPVIRRCLEKQPERRFQSMRDLAFALRHARAGRSASRPRRLMAPATGVRVLALLAALAVAGAAAVWRGGRPDPAVGGSRLAASAPPVTTGPPPRLPAAFDAYVRGRHALEKRDQASLETAIRYFQQSLDADPTYADAYVAMAESYAQLGYGSYVSPDESFPRARAAAQKALELDEHAARAHATLGYVSMYYDWNFQAAEAEFRRAIQLDPTNAVAHQWYAYLMTAVGRPFADAAREIDEAEKLDPLSPAIATDRAYISHYYGRDDEAVRSANAALGLDARFPLAYFWLGRLYTQQMRYADADRAFAHIGGLRAWTPAMAALGYLYGRMGRPADARAILAEFDTMAHEGRYASAYAIAIVYAGLEDRERVLSSLEAALHERSHWLVWLNRDPRLDLVRSDGRFQRLVREVGLPAGPR
jgi:tetratricopeptide (TPR) repeat protein